jgi:cell division protein FtsQ
MRRPRALRHFGRLPRPHPVRALHALPPRVRLVAVLTTFVLLLLGGLYLWLRDSSLVSVQQVRVTGVSGDNAHRIAKRLRAAALGMTTLDVDDDALRAAVAAFPEVRGIDAQPDFPHKLRIVVSQRIPVGALQAGNSRVAVASDGTLLPQERTSSLPTVAVTTLPTGSRLTDAPALRDVAVLAAAPAAMRGRVLQLAKGKGGLRATLRGGGTVVFGGATDLVAKWAAAAAVLRDPSAKGALYLDVRIPYRPVAGGLPVPPDTSGATSGDGTMNPLTDSSGDGTINPSATTATDGTTDPTATDPSAQNGQYAGASP